jgi:hypothetical protein
VEEGATATIQRSKLASTGTYDPIAIRHCRFFANIYDVFMMLHLFW